MAEELSKREAELAAAEVERRVLVAQQAAAVEAAKALGGSGIQSFVLEGALKHLEERWVVGVRWAVTRPGVGGGVELQTRVQDVSSPPSL